MLGISMGARKNKSRYDLDGRLADVIAAVTVFAQANESEGSLRMWANRLSRPDDHGSADEQQNHWRAVFEDHPEFFLVYNWGGERKVALRLRYANKTIDRETRLPHINIDKLTTKQRGDLTSLPLDGQATTTLINTAVSLHQAALARKADARFFYQTFGPALFALVGALIGIFGPILAKDSPKPSDVHVVRIEGASSADISRR